MKINQQVSSVGVTVFLICLLGGSAIAMFARLPWIAILGLLIGLYFLFAVVVVDQWEKVAVLRFGRYQGLRGPGLFFIIPVVDAIQ